MREIKLSLAKCRVKSRNFCVCKGSKCSNSRDFVYAKAQDAAKFQDFVHARARRAVISSACKGSSAVNFVHTRAQRLCNSQGPCGACKGSKGCNFQGSLRLRALNILQLPDLSSSSTGTQSASTSKVLRTQKFKLENFKSEIPSCAADASSAPPVHGPGTRCVLLVRHSREHRWVLRGQRARGCALARALPVRRSRG